MKKIIKYWKKSKIRTQIIFTYILILLLSFVMTFSMIWAVNNKYTKEEIGKAGVQTVSALHGNLALVFENVTQLSTYIYFDDIVQDSLRQINSANIDLNYQKNITKSLFKILPAVKSIGSEDNTTRLLNALRPFLSCEKQEKLDKAEKMLKLFKILPLLKDINIF